MVAEIVWKSLSLAPLAVLRKTRLTWIQLKCCRGTNLGTSQPPSAAVASMAAGAALRVAQHSPCYVVHEIELGVTMNVLALPCRCRRECARIAKRSLTSAHAGYGMLSI